MLPPEPGLNTATPWQPEPVPARISQPILVLGGFLISPEAYQPMASELRQLANQPVSVVPISKFDWLLTMFPFGWARILDRVAPMVQTLAAESPTGKVTLIGHSSGGIMLRLFLADGPFEGRHYRGRTWADILVMLGSPHTAIKATPLRQLVARQLPGAWFSRATESHPVRYVSVAGDLPLNAPGVTAPAPTATAPAAAMIAATAWCRSAQPCWRAPRTWCCPVSPMEAPSVAVGMAARRWCGCGGRR